MAHVPPIIRAKENLRLSHRGLILSKSKIFACECSKGGALL